MVLHITYHSIIATSIVWKSIGVDSTEPLPTSKDVRQPYGERTCDHVSNSYRKQGHRAAIHLGSCASKGDIVFLLDDEPSSIGSVNFERIKSFVSTIVGQFSVGNDTNQFSVVNFESSAREIFPLNRYQTVSSIQSAISSISFFDHYYSGTSIGSALDYARMYSFTTTRGARSDAAKIAVLITDGQSPLTDEAERLKAMGVTIFCVGVGTGVNFRVLRSVATHNDYTYLTTFDVLNLIAEELSNRTCADDINDCLGEPCLNGGTCEDQFGKYVCHCPGGITDPICYVPGLPNVTLGSPSSFQTSPGSTVILRCYVASPTSYSITWSYQKNGVTSVVNTGDTSKYSGGNSLAPYLTVKNVQVTDIGNYRCQATNTAGIGKSATMIHLDLSPDCDKLSCGVLRECLLMNNKPTCSVSTWKAAAVAVAGTVGAAVSVAAGVAAFKLLTRKAIQPQNGTGNSQGSNSNSNNRNNDNNDHNSDVNNSDDARESNHDDDMPDPNYIGGYQGFINSMPPPSM
uniref:Cartilage matrix protein n=1 Tax=Magallana gigas TaxID=29159 RepID=A0A8W8MVN0_MAGGI